jgi:hypothetical protein
MERTQEKNKNISDKDNTFWDVFEQTGSVSAYLLHNIVNENDEKPQQNQEEK